MRIISLGFPINILEKTSFLRRKKEDRRRVSGDETASVFITLLIERTNAALRNDARTKYRVVSTFKSANFQISCEY